MGYRLADPVDAPKQMIELMRACWSTRRPTFQSILSNIEGLLAENNHTMEFEKAKDLKVSTNDYAFIRVDDAAFHTMSEESAS